MQDPVSKGSKISNNCDKLRGFRKLHAVLLFLHRRYCRWYMREKENEGSTSKATCSSARHDDNQTDMGQNSPGTYIKIPLFGNSTGAAISGTSIRMYKAGSVWLYFLVEVRLSSVFYWPHNRITKPRAATGLNRSMRFSIKATLSGRLDCVVSDSHYAVPGSNLDRRTEYPDWNFSWLCSCKRVLE
jgi:hypothetical protein